MAPLPQESLATEADLQYQAALELLNQSTTQMDVANAYKRLLEKSATAIEAYHRAA